MALSTQEQDAVARLSAYNGNRYDESTNEYGLAGIGYQSNGPQAWNDTGLIANAIAREADVAEEAATTIAALAGDVPDLSDGALKFLRVNSGEDGYDLVGGVTFRDTSANLTSGDATFDAGALIEESDTGRLKLGDGATAFTGLPYLDRNGYFLMFKDGGSLTPATGTITVSLADTVDADEFSIEPSSDDTINITGVPSDRGAMFLADCVNFGDHTLTFQVGGVIKTPTVNGGAFASAGTTFAMFLVRPDHSLIINIMKGAA